MNELKPKLFDVMKGYTKQQLVKDIISGIIVAIIALPLSIAFTPLLLQVFLFPFLEEAVSRLADLLLHSLSLFMVL